MRAQASFNPKRQDVVKDAFIICIANSVFSLVSAMTVFSVLGFMATEQRVCVADVTEGGPGLAFVAFPTLISEMLICVRWRFSTRVRRGGCTCGPCRCSG